MAAWSSRPSTAWNESEAEWKIDGLVYFANGIQNSGLINHE
jgi:hypothetical protein